MTAARVIEKEGFAALALRLRGEGINNLELLTAVEQTPRTLFVPPQFSADAYSGILRHGLHLVRPFHVAKRRE